MRAQIASASIFAARWRGQLLDLLFPTRCVGCQRLGESLCADCRSHISLFSPPFCARCGHSLHGTGSACPHCRSHPLHIDELRAAAYHEGILRDAIHALKYNHRAELARPFAELLEQQLNRSAHEVDLITAVPLHPTRRRERGYNQAELIARELAGRISLPYVDGLVRTRATPDQIGLDLAGRHANVHDAFVADVSSFRRCRILLIDDVCTTGATLDACAVALRAQGALKVYGLAVARPR